MRKEILVISFLSCVSFCFGQEVKDTMTYKIPYLSKKGGQHIINIDFDKSKKEIVINAYSNVSGGQLIANPDEVKKAKETHSEKSFLIECPLH